MTDSAGQRQEGRSANDFFMNSARVLAGRGKPPHARVQRLMLIWSLVRKKMFFPEAKTVSLRPQAALRQHGVSETAHPLQTVARGPAPLSAIFKQPTDTPRSAVFGSHSKPGRTCYTAGWSRPVSQPVVGLPGCPRVPRADPHAVLP